LKEKALDCTLWRTRFGRGYGPVVGQTTEWMNGHTVWIVTYTAEWLWMAGNDLQMIVFLGKPTVLAFP
jgi:hypothetical protein